MEVDNNDDEYVASDACTNSTIATADDTVYDYEAIISRCGGRAPWLTKQQISPTVTFTHVLELAYACHRVKNRYRMMTSYRKFIDRITGNPVEEAREINSYRRFLWLNGKSFDVTTRCCNRKLTTWWYKSEGFRCSMLSFKSILDAAAGSPDIIDRFWYRVADLFFALFPEGVDSSVVDCVMRKMNDSPVDKLLCQLKLYCEKIEDESVKNAAISMVNVLNKLSTNPIVQDIAIKSDAIFDVANILYQQQQQTENIRLCPSEFAQHPKFQEIITTVLDNMSSGRYKASDVSSLVYEIVDAIPPDIALSKENIQLIRCIKTVVSDLEQNRQPDVRKLMQLLQDSKWLNFLNH